MSSALSLAMSDSVAFAGAGWGSSWRGASMSGSCCVADVLSAANGAAALWGLDCELSKRVEDAIVDVSKCLGMVGSKGSTLAADSTDCSPDIASVAGGDGPT